MPPTNQSVAAILRSAAEYVRSGWTQHMLAADEHGHPVNYSSPKAACWCTVGAMRLAAREYDEDTFKLAVLALKRHVGAIWIADWNNAPTRTKDYIATTMENLAIRLSGGVVSVS